VIRLLVVAVASLAVPPAAAQERVSPASVVARLKENEARYDNLEVRYVRRWYDPREKPGDPDSIRTETRVRSVRQNGMFRVSKDWSPDRFLQTIDEFRSACDGRVTRVRWGAQRWQHPRGETNERAMFLPHNLTLSEDMWAPLSTWLTGGPGLRYYAPGMWVADECEIRTRAARRTRLRGIECVRVEYDYHLPYLGGKPEHLHTVTLWLSPAHNYLPVREETVIAYKPYGMISEADCDDFREVRRGVWVPWRTTIHQYDWVDGVRTKSATNTVEVVSVAVNPSYPVAFFRDVR
jgi:hypothetical protein